MFLIALRAARTLKANEMSPNNNRVIVFQFLPLPEVSPEESGDGSTESKELNPDNDKDGDADDAPDTSKNIQSENPVVGRTWTRVRSLWSRHLSRRFIGACTPANTILDDWG